MSTLSLEERVEIATDRGCNISLSEYSDSGVSKNELNEFLDGMDIPRESEEE